MILNNKGKLRFNKYTVGYLLACAYIFTSYVAQDVIISSSVNSLCLYAFLMFSAYLFILEFRAKGSLSIFSLWFLIFIVASVVIMVYTPDIQRVWGGFYSMIVSFFVFFFMQIYTKDDEGFNGICWCYAISAFALVLLLLATGNLSGDEGDRLGQKLTGNANIFAMMMMVAVMFTMWLLLFCANNWVKKTALILMVIADLYALILSAGRKFFIIPFLFLYVLLINKKDKRGRKHVVLYTAVFVSLMVVISLLIINVEVLYNSLGVRMEGLLATLLGEEGDSSSEIREVIRNLAFEKWLERPFWGYGFDSFKFLSQKEIGHFYYSHCNYTELLYCGGVLYFLVYYWIFYKIVRVCFKNKSIPQKYKAFALAATISLFVFDYGAVTYNSTPTLVMLMMAFRAATFNETDNMEVRKAWGKLAR